MADSAYIYIQRTCRLPSGRRLRMQTARATAIGPSLDPLQSDLDTEIIAPLLVSGDVFGDVKQSHGPSPMDGQVCQGRVAVATVAGGDQR
jgi:hypothetical protein